MELHNLKPATGSTKTKKRLGRGQGSNTGGTAGRGHKGAGSRSGYKSKKGFEGGQMPLQRRVPKTGFKNFNRIEFEVLNLGKLQEVAAQMNVTEITVDQLRAAKLVKKSALVKILGADAEKLTSKINVTAHAISESAKAKIESLGGTVTILK